MFHTASSVFASRVSVWLATGMLVFPFVPPTPCHCSGAKPAEQRGASAESRSEGAPTAVRSCCASAKKQVISDCCRKRELASVPDSNRPCHCSPTCDCHLSRRSDPQPATPTPPTRNGDERVQLGASAHASVSVAVAEGCSPFAADESSKFIVATALDRCITLSRFLC